MQVVKVGSTLLGVDVKGWCIENKYRLPPATKITKIRTINVETMGKELFLFSIRVGSCFA
jgi:hypothetical protein